MQPGRLFAVLLAALSVGAAPHFVRPVQAQDAATQDAVLQGTLNAPAQSTAQVIPLTEMTAELVVPNASGTGTATATATGSATARAIIITATPQATATSTDVTTYTVVPGDTLFRIAVRFRTTVSRLATENGIVNPSLIYVGQRIRIPGGISGTPGAPTATPTATPLPGSTTEYVVQPRDTLIGIALRFRTTVSELVRINRIANPNIIYTGQRLQIPAAGGTTAVAAGNATTAAPTTTAAADAPTTVAVQTTVTPVSGGAVSGVGFGYGVEVYATTDNAAPAAAQTAELGMEWVKVEIDWRVYEPTQGQINFTPLDTIVDAMEAEGLNVMFTVATSPSWARTSTDEDGPPDDFNTYATFVGALASRYAGRVTAYEIWNEPNLRREWNSNVHPISAASYMQLLQLAYNSIKTADPAALVISAGLAPTGFNDGVNAINDRLYLDSMYRGGLAQYSDAIGAHPNGWANPPDARCCSASEGVLTHYEDRSFFFLDTLTDYREIMGRNEDAGTAIWVTRFGWGSSQDTAQPSAINVFVSYTDLNEQATYVPRAFELALNLGYIGPMFLSNLNGCQAVPGNAEICYYSLTGPTGSPRPVFSAVQSLNKLTVTATPTATATPASPTPVTPTATGTAIVAPTFTPRPDGTAEVTAPAETAEATAPAETGEPPLATDETTGEVPVDMGMMTQEAGTNALITPEMMPEVTVSAAG